LPRSSRVSRALPMQERLQSRIRRSQRCRDHEGSDGETGTAGRRRIGMKRVQVTVQTVEKRGIFRNGQAERQIRLAGGRRGQGLGGDPGRAAAAVASAGIGLDDRRYRLSIFQEICRLPRGDDLHEKACHTETCIYRLANDRSDGNFYLCNFFRQPQPAKALLAPVCVASIVCVPIRNSHVRRPSIPSAPRPRQPGFCPRVHGGSTPSP
jgi:hypothetical protein